MQRVGVVGLGPIGNRHAAVYRESTGCELVGVCDLLPERAAVAAEAHGVPAFSELGQMLTSVAPTMISVATGGEEYGSDHFRPTMEALAGGCHVLCEKPISNEIALATQMVDEAETRGLCLAVNLNHRFTTAARLAKQWVNEGRIGHLLFMNMSMWIMNRNESSPWFHIKAMHPHTVDVMRYFGGEITDVHCFAAKAPGRRIWSTTQMNIRFSSGAVGHLTGSYDIERGHPMERCEVAGVDGRLVIDDMYREATLFPAGDPQKVVYTNPVFGGFRDFNDTFRDRLGRFVDQLNEAVDPSAIDGSGADGLAAQRVLAAAIRSVETGETVAVASV